MFRKQDIPATTDNETVNIDDPDAAAKVICDWIIINSSLNQEYKSIKISFILLLLRDD